jgi:hypothetical protein
LEDVSTTRNRLDRRNRWCFSAFEFKWNTKKSNKAFPKTFIDNYAINKTLVVTPENIDDFLV